MEEKKELDRNIAIERSFVMIKPDGVQRGLIGEVIARFEKRGLKVIGLKMVKPSLEHMDDHYPKDDQWLEKLGGKGFSVFEEYGFDPNDIMGTADKKEAGKLVREWLINYMTEAPVVAMVVEGIHSVDMVRKIVGSTLPNKAEIGTIRGDYSVDSPASANLNKRAVKNLIHASESVSESEREIGHWFSEEEIYEYNRADHSAMF
jgi:nucleoside-diphosphate kinase